MADLNVCSAAVQTAVLTKRNFKEVGRRPLCCLLHGRAGGQGAASAWRCTWAEPGRQCACGARRSPALTGACARCLSFPPPPQLLRNFYYNGIRT